MSQLKGACIIGQSGGPSSVINASADGAIKTALESDSVTRVLGERIEPVANGRLGRQFQHDRNCQRQSDGNAAKRPFPKQERGDERDERAQARCRIERKVNARRARVFRKRIPNSTDARGHPPFG